MARAGAAGILRSLQQSGAAGEQGDGDAGLADAAPAAGGVAVPGGAVCLVFPAMGAAAGDGVAVAAAVRDAGARVAGGDLHGGLYLHGGVAAARGAGAGLCAIRFSIRVLAGADARSEKGERFLGGMPRRISRGAAPAVFVAGAVSGAASPGAVGGSGGGAAA